MALEEVSEERYRALAEHAGHTVEVVVYGDEEECSIECIDCGVVLHTIPRV